LHLAATAGSLPCSSASSSASASELRIRLVVQAVISRSESPAAAGFDEARRLAEPSSASRSLINATLMLFSNST